ncbi:hypothetical protein OROMI_013678 [Orobanche minor]
MLFASRVVDPNKGNSTSESHMALALLLLLPPSPNSLYVLTYLSQLIYKPHRALRELAQIYGPLMSFQLGDQLMVVASSPESAKEFCKTHDRIFSGRHLPSVYHNLPGTTHSSIMLAPDCSKSWKLLRSIGNPIDELLIGATDSTTITTVWLIVELMRNKEMSSKVRDEIAQAVEGDELNETRLSECHFFMACIKETLRLHVPAPMLVPHRAIETCKVNNHVIPKHSMILVNAWAIAQDPNYWENATTFRPERFLDSKIGYRGTHFEYLPSGTGLRMCPGSNVALKNIQMLVGSLLHYFDWSPPNGADPTTIDTSEKYLTTLKKAKPLLLIPKLRN